MLRRRKLPLPPIPLRAPLTVAELTLKLRRARRALRLARGILVREDDMTADAVRVIDNALSDERDEG